MCEDAGLNHAVLVVEAYFKAAVKGVGCIDVEDVAPGVCGADGANVELIDDWVEGHGADEGWGEEHLCAFVVLDVSEMLMRG